VNGSGTLVNVGRRRTQSVSDPIAKFRPSSRAPAAGQTAPLQRGQSERGMERESACGLHVVLTHTSSDIAANGGCKHGRDLVMRLPIFVSLALASGVVSFAASACDTRVDYGNKINQLQTEYQAAVGQATNAYVEKPCTVLDRAIPIL